MSPKRQALSGAASNLQMLGQFLYGSAEKGLRDIGEALIGPQGALYRRAYDRATPVARPMVPSAKNVSAGTQLRIGVGSRQGGYSGYPKGSAEEAAQRQLVRMGLQPRMADTPPTRFVDPRLSPGQQSLNFDLIAPQNVLRGPFTNVQGSLNRPPVSPGGGLNVRALAGTGAALLGIGGGAALLRLKNGETVRVPVRPDGSIDPAAASRLIDFGGGGNTTPATRTSDRRETSTAPASDRRSATTGQAGSGSVIQVSDDSRSDYEQAKQNALAAAVYAPDRNFERAVDYYSARRDYANQPDVFGNIMEQLIQRDERFADPNTLGAWATANKPLAYELSQQMPQVQTQEVVSEYGSNPINNLIGSRQGSEVGQAAVARPSIGISAPPMSTIQTRKAFEFPGGDTAIEEEMMKMYGGRPVYGDFPAPGTNAMAGVVRSLGYAG